MYNTLLVSVFPSISVPFPHQRAKNTVNHVLEHTTFLWFWVVSRWGTHYLQHFKGLEHSAQVWEGEHCFSYQAVRQCPETFWSCSPNWKLVATTAPESQQQSCIWSLLSTTKHPCDIKMQGAKLSIRWGFEVNLMCSRAKTHPKLSWVDVWGGQPMGLAMGKA